MTPESPIVAQYAREWAGECDWLEDELDLDAMPDAYVVKCASRHYDGGRAQLVRDALADEYAVRRV